MKPYPLVDDLLRPLVQVAMPRPATGTPIGPDNPP
jgi:hypothetical protein